MDICVPDRLPQSLGLCRMPGGGDKKSMGIKTITTLSAAFGWEKTFELEN